MPNRVIREGINSSDRIDALTDAQEVFYRRLLNVVDDFGRYVAKPALLQAACFPLRGARVQEDQILAWLAACAEVGLLQVYADAEGKDYLQIHNFRQHLRVMRSRYPDPPGGVSPEPMQRTRTADAPQMRRKRTADAPQEPPQAEPPPKVPKVKTMTQAELEADGLPAEVAADWLIHRRAKKALLTHTAWAGIKRQADRAGWPVADACAEAMTRGWVGFNAEWLEEAKKRNGTESTYAREQRERVEQFAPGVAARRPGAPRAFLEDITDVADKSH